MSSSAKEAQQIKHVMGWWQSCHCGLQRYGSGKDIATCSSLRLWVENLGLPILCY